MMNDYGNLSDPADPSDPADNVAFTLIELMVVMVIIVMLVAITMPIARYISTRSKQAQQKVLIEKIKNALEEYRTKYGEYPITPTYEYPEIAVNNRTNVVIETNAFSYVEQHYPTNIPTQCYYDYKANSNAPAFFTNFAWRSTNEYLCEEIQAQTKSVRVDYSMSYPLVLKQKEQGEAPLANINNYTVLYLATDQEVRGDYKRTVKRRGRGAREQKGRYGWPIDRPVFLDPESGRQLILTSDGQKYTLFYSKSGDIYDNTLARTNRVWRVPELK